MKLVFLGTPDFAVPSLEALASSSHETVLVVTQPDRPKGRGRKIEFPPVKKRALELGLKVAQPWKISTAEGIELLRSEGVQVGVVAAFGEILTADFLESLPLGFFNVHASLLPKYRGAAPVPHAILSGDEKTGVTIQKVVTEVDAGDIIEQEEMQIAPNETTGSLLEKLSIIGAKALVHALDEVESGRAVFSKQEHRKATYAPKIRKADARIDWSKSSSYLQRFVRAMNPWPGAFTFSTRGGEETRLIIDACKVAAGKGEPGTVLDSYERLVVAAGGADAGSKSGAIEILKLKRQGKKILDADEFLRGYGLNPGDRFF